jgi:hypothetical protein
MFIITFLTAASMKMVVFWNVELFSLVETDQRFSTDDAGLQNLSNVYKFLRDHKERHPNILSSST